MESMTLTTSGMDVPVGTSLEEASSMQSAGQALQDPGAYLEKIWIPVKYPSVNSALLLASSCFHTVPSTPLLPWARRLPVGIRRIAENKIAAPRFIVPPVRINVNSSGGSVWESNPPDPALATSHWI